MKFRQFVIVGISIGILLIGFLVYSLISKPKAKSEKKQSVKLATVFTEIIENDSVTINLTSTGVLQAVKRLELYSEVQGQMLDDEGKFKAGNTFMKDETLLTIRSNDQQAQVLAQRSSFESALTGIMVDLKIDYPDEFPKWEAYLRSYSITNTVSKLPEVKSEKLKSFLVGRNIYSSYHSLKNLEIVNSKYKIRAPYKGMLISANVNSGTVIRPGQALGVFIQPGIYEMETSIDALSAENLETGQPVVLTMQGSTKSWKGEIVRLVEAIDPSSQLITFYIQVKDDDLKEGMYLTAFIKAKKIPNAYEISRSALVNKEEVFVVQADTLATKTINLQHVGDQTIVFTGLENGVELVTKSPPSAFEGMKVTIYKEEK